MVCDISVTSPVRQQSLRNVVPPPAPRRIGANRRLDFIPDTRTLDSVVEHPGRTAEFIATHPAAERPVLWFNAARKAIEIGVYETFHRALPHVDFSNENMRVELMHACMRHNQVSYSSDVIVKQREGTGQNKYTDTELDAALASIVIFGYNAVFVGYLVSYGRTQTARISLQTCP